VRGKTGVPGEKPLRTEWRTNKLNPHSESGNRTHSTLVEGKFSHHYANPAPTHQLPTEVIPVFKFLSISIINHMENYSTPLNPLSKNEKLII